MADEQQRTRAEAYVLGYGEAVSQPMATRTAEDRAAFFLAYLRPGMRVLDCGCGPGSITVGLAQAVAPGDVIGIDVEPAQVERARALAAERGIENVRFERGDIYRLPFPDGSFDAVFEHALLVHLREPLAALREMRRVLAPGGLVGARDPVIDRVEGPPLVVASLDLVQRALAFHTGRHRDDAPYPYRRWLRLAGFERSEGSASITQHGTLEATRAYAEFQIGRLQAPAFRVAVLEQGWADEPTLAAMIEAVREWGAHPDSFAATVWGAALGWAPS
jgi:SAM-dependent methyltransferase